MFAIRRLYVRIRDNARRGGVQFESNGARRVCLEERNSNEGRSKEIARVW